MAKAPTEADKDRRKFYQLMSGMADGVILMGLDQSIVWANEAALKMHGVKKYKDLGKDVDAYRERFKLKYRNKHPVKDGDISIDEVLGGEESKSVIVEVYLDGNLDDCRIHSLRFQVVTNDDGTPDYVVLIVEDETDRYDAEDRFESAFNANPAPAMICRISDLRYVRVNRGFLEMTGFVKDDIIGRTAYEFDVLAGSRARETAIEKLRDGETIPQSESDLALPDGTTKCVIVAGQPIELSDEKCMLFTFADLEPRRKAEKALRHSEERFSKAFKLSPVATTISRLNDLRLIEVNEAFTRLSGYGKEQVIGRSGEELDIWVNRDGRKAFSIAFAEHGSVRDFEFRMRTAEGAEIDCLIAAERVVIEEAECVLCVISDVSETKRTEAELMEAIEAVMTDASWFSRKIVEKLAALRQTAPDQQIAGDLDSLSNRERQVLELICEGRPDAEISQLMNVSRNTVRNHVSALYRKIGVTRRSGAVVWARERGVVGRPKSRIR